MKIYLAGPYSKREAIAFLANELEAYGHTIGSSWITLPSAEDSDARARICLADLATCEVLVALEPLEWADLGRGGRDAELGFALAIGLPIVVVGRRRHVFHHLAVATVMPMLEADGLADGLLRWPLSQLLWELDRIADARPPHAVPALELWIEREPFTAPVPIPLRDLHGWELAGDAGRIRVGRAVQP